MKSIWKDNVFLNVIFEVTCICFAYGTSKVIDSFCDSRPDTSNFDASAFWFISELLRAFSNKLWSIHDGIFGAKSNISDVIFHKQIQQIDRSQKADNWLKKIFVQWKNFTQHLKNNFMESWYTHVFSYFGFVLCFIPLFILP